MPESRALQRKKAARAHKAMGLPTRAEIPSKPRKTWGLSTIVKAAAELDKARKLWYTVGDYGDNSRA